MILAYTSPTGTRSTIAAVHAAGWRWLLTPSRWRPIGTQPYALDNGAWACYCQGRPLDLPAFTQALRRVGARADWTVLPDIVAGGHASLALSLQWMRWVLDESPRALLAVQDGLGIDDVAPFVGARVGIFVGGSTAWKLATLPQWGALGQRVGCWIHVGRVNSTKRIHLCQLAGATSFDGTGVSRYPHDLPLLDHTRNQLCLWKEGIPDARTKILDGREDS